MTNQGYVIRKPSYGDKCNNCGFCCMSTSCQLSILYGSGVDGEPCHNLISADDGVFICGLIVDPDNHLNAAGMRICRDNNVSTEAIGLAFKNMLVNGECDSQTYI